MNPIQPAFRPLRDALDRVDLSALPEPVVKLFHDSTPVDLLMFAVDGLYAAYTIARQTGRFDSPTVEAFHDHAVEKLALALEAIKRDARWHYDRDTVAAAAGIGPDEVYGYAVGRGA